MSKREGDEILIHSLRDLGCTIPETSTSLSSFDSSILIHITARCLSSLPDENRLMQLDPSLKSSLVSLSTTVPKSIAQKHRQCTRLSDLVSKLGYTRECNYNHFLYPNVNDTKSILSFLLSTLTKTKQKSKKEKKISGDEPVERRISKALKKWTKQTWIPTLSLPMKTYFSLPLFISS